jgi:hypothetical protein
MSAQREIAVTVVIEPATKRKPARYVVTTQSGFRAEIPRCEDDKCAPNGGWRPECRTKLDARARHAVGGRGTYSAWTSHAARFCHGWHDARVADFAADVARTYGSYLRPTPGRVRAMLRGRPASAAIKGDPEAIALYLPGWTVDDVRHELLKAEVA